MKNSDKRLSVADQIKRGLEDAVLCAKGELELRTTVIKVAPPPMSPQEIVRLREDLGLNQRSFALALDICERTLKSWERGERSPSAASLGLLHKMKAQAETSRPGRRVSSKNGLRTPTAPRKRDKNPTSVASDADQEEESSEE